MVHSYGPLTRADKPVSKVGMEGMGWGGKVIGECPEGDGVEWHGTEMILVATTCTNIAVLFSLVLLP